MKKKCNRAKKLKREKRFIYWWIFVVESWR
jgi:hypothetical protein